MKDYTRLPLDNWPPPEKVKEALGAADTVANTTGGKGLGRDMTIVLRDELLRRGRYMTRMHDQGKLDGQVVEAALALKNELDRIAPTIIRSPAYKALRCALLEAGRIKA